MSDPVFTTEDYAHAFDVVRHLGENLAIQFQMEGESWDRETMQKHVNQRSAILFVQKMILDSGEALEPKEGK